MFLNKLGHLFHIVRYPALRQRLQHSITVSLPFFCALVQNRHHTSIRFCSDRPSKSLSQFTLHIWQYHGLDIVMQGYCFCSASLRGSGTGNGKRAITNSDTISPGKSIPSQHGPAANNTALGRLLNRRIICCPLRHASSRGNGRRFCSIACTSPIKR